MKTVLAAASAAVLAAAVPAVASAQTANMGLYSNTGYAHLDADDGNLGALQIRAGYRFNDWIGAEGEAAWGVKGEDVTVGGVTGEVELDWQAAAYVVGFAPIGPRTDLLARIGYGKSEASASALGFSQSVEGDSWNFGVGAQHSFDGKNGVRVDYTRHEFNDDGGAADVWSIAYVRRY